MYYKYDSKSMTYVPVDGTFLPMKEHRFMLQFLLIMLLVGCIGFFLGRLFESANPTPTSEKELKVLIEQTDVFTKEKFMDYLKELNVRFPEIVYAQAVLETGNFQSEVFKANKNLFGMKEASIRATTNHGTNLNHAVYNHWRESVLDYALYQCSYLSDLKSKSEYYNYLSQYYAEDKTYVSKVKEIAESIEP